MYASADPGHGGAPSLYESVPYPRYVFPQTSPNNLAVLSALYGLEPAAPSRCRYLELGCGIGSNNAAFATRLPNARFVGIDLAESHISSAQRMSSELALTNTEFIAADLTDLDPASLGQFDFIVAHGLFSWVPDVVRSRVLELMKLCLTPHGAGYISYNALPGCHFRRIGWDLLRFGTKNIEDPRKKVESAADIASFFSRESPQGSTQRSIYQSIAAGIESRRPENILHDDLSESNRPFYFFEFADLLRSNEMKFLCEADPPHKGRGNLSQSALEELDRMALDPIEREQMVDFLDFATFRQSVICHSAAPCLSAASPGRIRKLLVEWSFRQDPAASSSAKAGPARFSIEGASVETDHPLTKVILSKIIETSPLPIKIGDTIERYRSEGSVWPAGIEDADESRALQFLLDLYESGFIRLFTEEPPIDSLPGGTPEVHVFARWQASNGLDIFTTPLDVNIAFGNEVVKLMMILLDGTRDRRAAADEIVDRIQIPSGQLEQVRSSIPQVMESNIEELRKLGVFVRR